MLTEVLNKSSVVPTSLLLVLDPKAQFDLKADEENLEWTIKNEVSKTKRLTFWGKCGLGKTEVEQLMHGGQSRGKNLRPLGLWLKAVTVGERLDLDKVDN
jgi:hypothetical protein